MQSEPTPVLFDEPRRGDYFKDTSGRWHMVQKVLGLLPNAGGYKISYDHAGWAVEAEIDFCADQQWHELTSP